MSDSSSGDNYSDSGTGGGMPGNREVAHRLFAAEYDDATYSYSESDEERAPNYVVTPTGARVNRLFAVGVLTEVGQAGESMLRARVADPTGAFVVYAGQYQPEAMAFLDSAEPPAFVAVTGKARTFQPEDSDRVFTSVRPEEITEVDSETRDRWTVSTAERTLSRIAAINAALETDYTGDDLRDALRESDVDPSLAAGIPIAIEQYGTTRTYLAELQRLSLDATRLVADEIDAVDDLALSPADGDGSGSIEPVFDDVSISTPPITDTDAPESSPATASAEEEVTTTTQSDQIETASEPVSTAEETTADVTEPVRTESAQTEPARTESTQTEPIEETTASTSRSSNSGAATTQTQETADDEEFDPEEFELDEEVRQEVESEYGTEFSTASEVGSPGETEIETDDSGGETEETDAEPSFDEIKVSDTTDEPDTTDEESTQPTLETSTPESEVDTELEEPSAVGESDTTADDTDTQTEIEDDTESEAASEDAPLDTVLIETMRELNDGDGADRAVLVEQVSERAGVSDEAVEEAIQEALMSGQCYEPNDDKLKPI